MTQFTRRQPHRAQQLLGAVGRAYPHAWKDADHLRSLRGNGLANWPSWCYLPMAGAYAIVSGGGDNRVPFERSHHIGIVAALAAWRMGQGVYRFDRDLAASLDDTPIPTDLPVSLLYRLPEWCVYLETPGLWAPDGRPLAGAWVHLEWDEDGADELRILLDCDGPLDDQWHSLIPVPLILGRGSIAEAIERMAKSGQMQAEALGYKIDPLLARADMIASRLWPIVSRVLYLCIDEPDMAGRPERPQPKRTKDGWRLFPADGLRVWPVGERIGAAIRRAQEADERAEREATASGHARPRPHIRRAHWHSYWTGPRAKAKADERKLVVMWTPPIAVNIEDMDASCSTGVADKVCPRRGAIIQTDRLQEPTATMEP